MGMEDENRTLLLRRVPDLSSDRGLSHVLKGDTTMMIHWVLATYIAVLMCALTGFMIRCCWLESLLSKEVHLRQGLYRECGYLKRLLNTLQGPADDPPTPPLPDDQGGPSGDGARPSLEDKPSGITHH